MPQFDTEAAKKAGYTDDEILDHLSKSRGFDLSGALKSGYTKGEVLKHLTTTPSSPSSDKRGTELDGALPLSLLDSIKTVSPKQIIGDVVQGVGSGVASTAEGAYNLGRKILSTNPSTGQSMGLGVLPEAPEFLQKAAAPVQYDKDGNAVSPSASFRAGRIGEQVGEFFIPGGTVSRVAKGAEAIGGGGMVGKALGFGTRVLGDAAATGGISAIQTGGDFEQAENAAMSQAVMTGAFGTIGGMLKAIPFDKLYISKLKFPERFQGQQVDDILDKAIGEGILISQGGANKIGMIEKLEKLERDGLIAPHLNDLVDPNVVAAPVQRLRQMASELGEEAIVRQIDARLASFYKAKGMTPPTPAQTISVPGANPRATLTPAGQPTTQTIPGTPGTPPKITVREAIQAKDDFQLLAKNFFGKFSEGKGEIRKLMAAGLNDALEDISPAYREANRDIQNSKLLKQAIQKYIDSNPGVFNDPRLALLAWWNVPLAITKGVMSSPYLRSALAIAGSRTAKAAQGIGSAGGKVIGSQGGFPQFAPPIPELEVTQ